MDAKVARSATVKATSAAAGTPVTVPSSSKAAIPPVPINCAAIMRSVSPGPRRIDTSPSASITRMNPTAAVRNSVIVERSNQGRFLCDKLGDDGLFDVEAVIDKLPVFLSGWHRARQQAGECCEHVTTHPGRKTGRVGDKSRAEGQPGIERASCNVGPGNDGVIQEEQYQLDDGNRRAPGSVRLQQMQARPRRRSESDCCGGNISDVGASEHEPKEDEPYRSQSRARPPSFGGYARGSVSSSQGPSHPGIPRSVSDGAHKPTVRRRRFGQALAILPRN